MPEKPDVSIIIVNYNSAPFLRDCLFSLYSAEIKAGFEIVVYDNGDPSSEMDSIQTEFSSVKFITDRRHVSYAAANNAGAVESTGEYIFFLNPDTIVRSGSIDGLLEFIEKTPDCGAVGPRLVNKDGKVEISCALDAGIFSEAYMKLLKSLPSGLKYRIFGVDRIRKTDVVVGAALMVKSEVFARVGGYDEGYPLYFEESDLCLRIRQMGYSVYYYPEVEIVHYLGSAGGIKKQGLRNKELTQSEIKYRIGQLRYYKKHRGLMQNSLLKTYLFFKFGSKIGKLIIGQRND